MPREGFAATSGAVGLVALRTELTPELVEEGLFREVVHRVQSLRKDLALEYTQRIDLALSGDAALLAAVRGREQRLQRDTLAERVSTEPAPAWALGRGGEHSADAELDGRALRIGLWLAGARAGS